MRKLAACAGVWLCAIPAAAQSPTKVIADALGENNPAAIVAVLKQQATTLPLGTSSGGFTFEFDPALGLVVRRSQSFGAIFSDRPQTIGRRRVSVAVSTQRTSWTSIAGQDLRRGEVYWSDKYNDDFITHKNEPNIDKGITKLDLVTERTSINVTYGLSDRIDVSLVVPFGRTSVNGSYRFSTIIPSTGNEYFVTAESSSATVTGLSDVSIKSKFRLMSKPWFSAAAVADVRLPTGNADDLLGIGARHTKLSALASFARGRVSPHLEGGYVFAGSGLQFQFSRPINIAPSDEVVFDAGADVVVSTRVTIAGDVLSRSLRDSAIISRTILGPDDVFLRADPGTVSLVLGTVGAKIAVGSSWLLTASVLFPLNDAGVRPGLTPVIGFERAF